MAIRKINLTEEFKYVSLKDAAVDKEKSDLEAYAKDMDVKHLVFHPDQYPTFFILKNLNPKQFAQLLSKNMKFDYDKNTLTPKEGSNGLDMVFDSFEVACGMIEEQGKRMNIKAEELPMDVLQDVSTAIMARAQLSSEEKK